MLQANIYIDGFNLYYGALKGTLHRWLDVSALCKRLLPNDTIHRIRYYTASVRPRKHDPDQRTRQKTYWRALRSIGNLTIHEGHFLSHTVTMPLASNPSTMVAVIKTEEKGSDVNIAAHLLRDGYHDDYEVAVLITNDSDLLEPIRIVQRELRNAVGILDPQRHPSFDLRREATFFKKIRRSTIARCPFPETLTDPRGSFRKPSSW